MPLSQNDLDWFAARLSIAVYEANRITPEMSIHELKEALRGVPGIEHLTMTYAPDALTKELGQFSNGGPV